MAATRRNAMRIEEARLKIKTTQLLKRLTDNALGLLRNPAGEPYEMSASQVRSAEVVLRKAVPDLSTAYVEGNIRHSFTDFLRQLSDDQRSLEPPTIEGVAGQIPEAATSVCAGDPEGQPGAVAAGSAAADRGE